MKFFWWETKNRDDLHSAVHKTIEALKKKQAGRAQDNLRNMRLYGNLEILGLRSDSYHRTKSLNKLTLNVIQSNVDTATSKIAKTKPKVTFLTDGGDYSAQSRGKKLEQFSSGWMHKAGLYDLGPQVFRDSGIFGDGLVYFYPKFQEKSFSICVERVFPEEITIDEDEAIYGNPRQLHRTKYINREVLKSKYPKFKRQIDEAPGPKNNYLVEDRPEVIEVYESWHLPSGPDSKDGVHCLTVQNATLEHEDYKLEWLPFEKYGWNPRVLGYWSQGIAEQLTGIQIEMNKLLKRVQLAMHLCSVPRVMVENGSKVVKQHLNNDVGSIITYEGTLPQWDSQNKVQMELFAQIENLYQKSFEITGISQLSAQSKKPSGLDSGKAIREYHDIETERFAVQAQRYEQFYVNCCEKMIKMAKHYEEMGKEIDFNVMAQNDYSIEKINFKDVNMESDAYVMKPWPTALLSDSPAGKLSDVMDLMSVGLIDKRQASVLLDYPDIKSITDRNNAPTRNIEMVIEEIVERGNYVPPEQFQDLSNGIVMMQTSYLHYMNMKLPEQRLELFLRWIDDAMAIVNPPVTNEDVDNIQAMESEADAELMDQAQLEMEQGETIPTEAIEPTEILTT